MSKPIQRVRVAKVGCKTNPLKAAVTVSPTEVAAEPDLPLGQCRFEEGHHRRTWKPMPCTEMKHRTDKVVAAVGGVITPSCPVVVFSEKIQYEI